jgi:HTH-type transcriptional regulator / antitoxin HigA
MSKAEYKELIAFHPGYYLKEIIEDMEITQDEFAKRLETTGKNLSDLLNGKSKLSNEIALKLSIMFGTSADVWLNLQKTYNEKIIEIERRKLEDYEAGCAQLIDYSYFIDLGVVPIVRKSADKAKELLKYFKIASFSVLKNTDFLVNYRTAISTVNEKNIINSNAWVQTALNIGQQLDTESFDQRKLKSHLQEIRKMTLQNPVDFLPRLKEIFASCGVAFVVLPHLKNSGVNGAVKWINKEKVILAINNRRKYADIFWFSLFHEIGHVLQRKIAMLIVGIDVEEMDETNKILEREADDFARNSLLPMDHYCEFLSGKDYSEEAIRRFANKMDIHPGIVVGRLQLEGHIGFERFNRLRGKYIIH